MGVYGYCVVPWDHAPAGALAGVSDAAVRPHAVADLAVWVSEIERPDPTVENIEAHNRVVEAAVTGALTPVPLRFGQWAAELAVFEAVIAEKTLWYRERLSTFEGALEFGLRVIRPDRVRSARVVRTPPAASGREYMNSLRDRVATAYEQRQDEERIRAGISEELGRFVREERMEEGRTPHGVLTASHLVARADFDEYLAHARNLRLRFPELRFLLSGPWAPYSFAG